ncbi:ATP-binding protein [Yoonia sp.]|uniref:ATP-binding protein n=1 Tax=Yoonia sp. TaxID=2212373 RepID=UPI002FD953C5
MRHKLVSLGASRLRSLVWLLVLAAFGGAAITGGLDETHALDTIAAFALVFLLAVLAGLAAHRIYRHQAAVSRRVAAAAIALCDEICFVTDRHRRVAGASRGAAMVFGAAIAADMDTVFAGTLAEPARVFSQLTDTACGLAGPMDPAEATAGQYRFSLRTVSPDCLLWTCTPAQPSLDVPRLPVGLPAMIGDGQGAVLAANDALTDLLGETPTQISAILDASEVTDGKIAAVRTQAGLQDYLCSTFPAAGAEGDRIILLTRPAAMPPRAPEWDTIEDLPVPLLKVTEDGRLAASNREARKLLQIPASEGRRLADVLEGPGRPINDWLSEAVRGQGMHVSEFLRGRGENRETFVQVTLSAADTGDDRHLIAVLNDVTELKTLEAQFVQSQKMQAIGQLAGGVAHDFNNLLTAISGHCDLLLLRHDEGHQDYADLIQIHQNSNRAAGLVGQLLAFSRKQNLQLEIIDVRETLAHLTHLLNRLVGEKVRLTLEHDTLLGPIRADRRQLEQVLMNLVVNARDAMQGAGEIRVVTNNMTLASVMRKDRAEVPPGDYVVVNVIDKGCGIPPDKLTKIFEPFYTTKRTGEGTGLGLSTVYGIVKQTGGFVFVESELGKGTTFSLLFPQQKTDLPKAVGLPPAANAPQLGHPADGVVLLVEDEAPVRAFASRALRLKGYTVLEADCAEAALDMLAAGDLHVDVFVTDVIMPGMDGPTWVRQALGQRPETKVVFVSGYPEDAFEDGEEPISNAVFLPKPFSLNALTRTVQSQLLREPEDA